MNTSLQVRHSLTYDQRPMATIEGLPGGSADLTPAQMRALAKVLIAAAADCEAAATRPRPRIGSLLAASFTYSLRT